MLPPDLVARTLRVAEVLTALTKTSKFVNLLTPKDKAKYATECWDLLQEAYKSIGGFQSAASPEHLINDSFLWKLNVRQGKVVALRVYKNQYGRKAVASATDGTSTGKAALREIYKEDLTRAWTECSGAVEHTLKKLGGEAYIVPASYAEKLTGKKVTPSDDGLHYSRQIGGHMHEKIIIGSPTGISINRTVVDELSEAAE